MARKTSRKRTLPTHEASDPPIDPDDSEDEAIARLRDQEEIQGFTCPSLVKNRKEVPLFEQEVDPNLSRDERKRKVPLVFQPIQPSLIKKPKPLKKAQPLPRMKQAVFEAEKFPLIKKTSELFPRWIDPPQKGRRLSYARFFKQHTRKPEEYLLDGVPSHQRTEKNARRMCSLNMKRPPTQDLMKKKVETFTDKGDAEAYKVWWNKSGHLVSTEALLTYWRNDLHLRFKPAEVGKKERPDGTVHGTYEALIVTPGGEQKVVEVAADWVKNNVSEEARGIIHRVSTDLNSVQIRDNMFGERGFITVENNDLKPNRDLSFEDKRQVSMIRYLPAKKIVTTQGNEVTVPEKWRGVIKHEEFNAQGDPGECVDLDTDWVEENIGDELQAFVKSMRDYGTTGYVRIPEGAPADHAGCLESNPDAPRLRYTRQGSVADNDRTCVLKGAASCLCYLGYKRIAHILCNDLGKGNREDTGFDWFKHCTEPVRLEKSERRQFQYMHVKNQKLKSWDVLVDSKEYLMCLVGLQGSDGKTDHAVAVAGNWIFDSNFEHALPLSKQSLDLCCSDGETKCSFVKITRACMLKRLKL